MARLVWVLTAAVTLLCVAWLANTLRPYKAADERPRRAGLAVGPPHSHSGEEAPKPQADALPVKVEPPPPVKSIHQATAPTGGLPGDSAVSRMQDQSGDEERFLFVCVQYGRHNNQLIALAKSYSLAYHSNRTLVLPRMYKKHPYDETTRPAEEFYDLSGGPVRVLTSGEFQTRWGGHTWQQRDVLCIDGAQRCAYAKGRIPCSALARLPPASGQRNAAHVMSGPRLVVTGGENTFFANVPHSPCMYRWLKLQPKYQTAVRQAQEALKLPADYFGLHVRWMENKCRWALGKAHTKAYEKHGLPKPDFLRDIFPMCQMQPEYYRKFWNGTGPFFVAHDHQAETAYYRKLARDGAVFYSSLKGMAMQGDKQALA
eukprot:EG_transcript_14709